MCQCGRNEEAHEMLVQNVGLAAGKNTAEWSMETDTGLFPCNAFGELAFEGQSNSRAKVSGHLRDQMPEQASMSHMNGYYIIART